MCAREKAIVLKLILPLIKQELQFLYWPPGEVHIIVI